MNYLAHIYLSKNDKELRIGNFIADSVRGKDFSMFPKRVAQGIILHRHIDTFTDQHAIVKQSKNRIRKKYGHWSGLIVDIYYDHFLAANWKDYHSQPLMKYVETFYNDLLEHYSILPDRVQGFLPIMIEQNWLKSYETIEGISNIFNQMNMRTKGISKMDTAPNDLVENYSDLENDFHLFMKDLKSYVIDRTKELKV